MALQLTEQLRNKIISAARKVRPQELCGVIIAQGNVMDFVRLDNVSTTPNDTFKIDHTQLAAAETEYGHIYAIVHSHPTSGCLPSAVDIAQCNTHATPYVIVGKDNEFHVQYPQITPLIGRSYVHGSDDCFGIVRDYYSRELGIYVPDFARDDMWWSAADSASLYVDNFTAAGFIAVPKTTMQELQRHDVLLCYWGDTLYPNHALIWLGSDAELMSEDAAPCVGHNLYLHHAYNSLASRAIMGDTRFSSVSHVLRHKELIHADN